jgi:hypothetical protein
MGLGRAGRWRSGDRAGLWEGKHRRITPQFQTVGRGKNFLSSVAKSSSPLFVSAQTYERHKLNVNLS